MSFLLGVLLTAVMLALGYAAGRGAEIIAKQNHMPVSYKTYAKLSYAGMIGAVAGCLGIPFILLEGNSLLYRMFGTPFGVIPFLKLGWMAVYGVIGIVTALLILFAMGKKEYRKDQISEQKRHESGLVKQAETAQKQNEIASAAQYYNDPHWLASLHRSITDAVPPRGPLTPGYSLQFCVDGAYIEGNTERRSSPDAKAEFEPFRLRCMSFPFTVTEDDILLELGKAYEQYVMSSGTPYQKFEYYPHITGIGDGRYVAFNIRP